MNKKTVILCIILIAVLIAGIGVAVYFLYHGRENPSAEGSDLDLSDSKCGFFSAVPADALALFYFSGSEQAVNCLTSSDASIPLLPDGDFKTFLSALGEAEKGSGLGSLRSSQTIISAHYAGGLETLFVLDLCKAGSSVPTYASVIEELASNSNLSCKIVDCSRTASAGPYLIGRQIIVVSTSSVLAESCERHIMQGVSVLDKENIGEAYNAVKSENCFLLISNENSEKLFDEVFNREYRSYSDAVKRMADWTAFSVSYSSGGMKLSGVEVCGTGANKYVNVFSDASPATVTALSAIPAYAVSAFAMPVSNVSKHIDAYRSYAGTKIGSVKYNAEQERLKKEYGASPSTWAESLGIKELATASFYVGENVENVLLMKIGNSSAIAATFDTTDREHSEAADYAYPGFVSSLFGSLFSSKNEVKFTIVDDWVVVGSAVGVDEYVSGKALENTLDQYLSGSNVTADLKNQHFFGYFSLSEDSRAIDRLFRPKYAAKFKENFGSVTYAPVIFTLGVSKGQRRMSLKAEKVDVVKSKAPELERDATVTVTNGSFSVKNSGTGKMNTFYQQDNMYLCLSDENGKGLWGVAFSTPICGRAGTIDYYANGKLQILFGSGTKLYLIDRLGRFVSPFPVELGKEILLGPDIYDFNGQRKYNVMVLHTDNTIEMYNLQGKKPDSWKGITFSETIMDLPEKIEVEGKTYWVVRTSLQTLIFPFYGGEPLTTFKGNDKLRPDSKITVVKDGVTAVNYNGKEVTVTLK